MKTLILSSLVLMIAAVGSYRTQGQGNLVDAPIGRVAVDPITTGSPLTRQQLDDWQARRIQFTQCGNCEALKQPYPAH